MATDSSVNEVPQGPVVFGYEGSAAAERALRLMAPMLTTKRALVVTVWEPGVGFALVAPTIPLAPIDVRAALQVEQAVYENAQQMAEQGAATARQLGLEAEGLAVADALTTADTLVRIARECDAAMVVVGSHGHKGVRALLVGSTTRAVIRKAPCPVGVVRHRKDEQVEGGAANDQ